VTRPSRSALVLALALAAAAGLAHAARAGGPGDPHRAGHVRGPGRHGDARATQRQLEVFTRRRELDARAEVRAASRDATRRADAERLRQVGTPVDVAAARERALAEERSDALAARVDLDRLERAAGHRLGPVTRRVLEESRIELRADRRARDVEDDARALERDVRRRETAPTGRLPDDRP
jgi:hypothetical protein